MPKRQATVDPPLRRNRLPQSASLQTPYRLKSNLNTTAGIVSRLLNALGAFQKAEIEKWWPIIKAAGIRAE
jgi:hypothetical protein